LTSAVTNTFDPTCLNETEPAVAFPFVGIKSALADGPGACVAHPAKINKELKKTGEEFNFRNFDSCMAC
jgi:hypothetical protein